MLALVLAIVAGVLFALDAILWFAVPTYKTRTVVSVAGVVLSVSVILLALGS